MRFIFAKKFFFLFVLLTACVHYSIAQQVTDLSGVYKGSLFQGDESYTFNVTMTLKQEGKSITGTFLSESTGKSRFFVTYNIAGTTDGRMVQWKDISVANERSSGTWFWCIKMVRAAIAATSESTVLSCDWKNDGGRMFYKKLAVQNRGAACSPGSFKLYKEGEPAPFVQDTLPIAKAKPKAEKIQDTVPVVKAKKAERVRDTTPVVIAEPKVKKERDSIRIKKTKVRMRDTMPATAVKTEPQVQDTTPMVKAEPKIKKAQDSTRTKRIKSRLRDTTPVVKAKPPVPDNIPVVTAAPQVKKPDAGIQTRAIDVKQTIDVVSDTLTLYFYDNGVIDNDTISVYYNKALVVSQQRLSYNPITIKIPVRKDGSNELVMFANNEGEVPPNSALLVFTDNKIRREITMVSTLKRSGSIVFTKK